MTGQVFVSSRRVRKTPTCCGRKAETQEIKDFFKKLSRFNVDVLLSQCNEVLKKKKKKKKRSGCWILAFCSSWFGDFSHGHLLFSSLRLRRPRQLHSPWFDSWLFPPAGPVFGFREGRFSHQSTAGKLYPLTLGSSAIGGARFESNQPRCESPLLCFNLAGEFIGVAAQASEPQSQVSRPSRF